MEHYPTWSKTMTKQEIIQKIYGENPPFVFDTALPQTLLDNIAKDGSEHMVNEAGYNDYKYRVYNRIYSGCVFAYDKRGSGSGLLPLTMEARTELQISNYASYIYVPVMEEIITGVWQ